MSNEKKDKGIAIAGTIVVHALVLLVLFLMAFRTPLPLPGEEGVEVDLGMMDQGMGNIQPEKPAIPMAAQPQQQQNKSKEDIKLCSKVVIIPRLVARKASRANPATKANPMDWLASRNTMAMEAKVTAQAMT